ncbi:unnamed protein product [Closterium sp. Naga37s-1]|nr:unnamed protein product [Closterium sp. Naga37s-1]
MVEFLGRIVGKALYEGILLEYSFAPLFVSKLVGRYAFLDELSSLDMELYRNLMYLKVGGWIGGWVDRWVGVALVWVAWAPVLDVVGRYAFLDELSSLDMELYRNLMYLKHYEGDASELALDFTHYEGDASELALDFTVTEEVLGEHSIVELRALTFVALSPCLLLPYPSLPMQHYEGDASELALDFTVTEEVLGEHSIHYEGDASELALDFTVTEEVLGEHSIVELRPGGSHIAVTNENKLQYIHAVADYKLNRQMAAVVAAFLRGLSDLIQPEWLRLFSPKEFNQLLSGGEQDVDVEDLKAHTRYSGGYTESDRTIRMFWEVVKELSREEKSQLLKFVTSCSRPPLLGFKHLNPPLTIHKVNVDASMWATLGGPDVDWLPTASTCYNLLKVIIAPVVLQPAQGNHCSCCATTCSR